MACGASMCCEAGVLICRTCDIAETLGSRSPGGYIRDYEELCQIVGGPIYRRVLLISKNAAFISCIVVFMVFCTDSVANFFPGGPHPGRQLPGECTDENA